MLGKVEITTFVGDFPLLHPVGGKGKDLAPHWQGAELKRGQWHLLLANWAGAHCAPQSRTTAARLPLWPDLILSAFPGASGAQCSHYHCSAHNKLGYICVHSLASLFNVGTSRGALQGGWWMVVSLATFYFQNSKTQPLKGAPPFFFFSAKPWTEAIFPSQEGCTWLCKIPGASPQNSHRGLQTSHRNTLFTHSPRAKQAPSETLPAPLCSESSKAWAQALK